jgi:hypothetical protein
MRRLVASLSLLALPAIARSDDETDKRTETDEPTAADVAGAPLPGQESGRTDAIRTEESRLHEVVRGVLVFPRAAVELVLVPVRGTLWAYERYAVPDRFRDTFYDHTHTYGLYPTLHVDATYGVTFGGRFVHRDLLGDRERFSLRAGLGGEFRQLLDASATSGNRLGDHMRLELRGEYERRPHDPFYGIGNNYDVTDVRHRQQLARVSTAFDVRPFHEPLHLRLAGAYTDLEYAPASEGPMITDVYPMEMLPGFESGIRNTYAELELRLDERRKTNPFDAHAIPDRGYLLAAFGGRVHQLGMGEDHWRYGGEAQHFLPLTRGGMRTLHSRVHAEAVTGGYRDVAFTQLPQLGGATMLRGYPAERFRDRAAVLGSVEYFWDLNRILMASLFVDAGRVYPDVRDIAFSVDDFRVGYGVSLQLHSTRSFLASVNLASSIDGGVFVNFALDPVYEPPSRLRQK